MHPLDLFILLTVEVLASSTAAHTPEHQAARKISHALATLSNPEIKLFDEKDDYLGPQEKSLSSSHHSPDNFYLEKYNNVKFNTHITISGNVPLENTDINNFLIKKCENIIREYEELYKQRMIEAEKVKYSYRKNLYNNIGIFKKFISSRSRSKENDNKEIKDQNSDRENQLLSNYYSLIENFNKN